MTSDPNWGFTVGPGSRERRAQLIARLGLEEPIGATWFFDLALVMVNAGKAGELPCYVEAWKVIGRLVQNDPEVQAAFKATVRLGDQRARLLFLFSLPGVQAATSFGPVKLPST